MNATLKGIGPAVAPISRRRASVVIAIAVVWLGVILAVRFAFPDPNVAIPAFFVLPIALVAVELGIVPGLICAAAATGFFAVWVVADGISMTFAGYVARTALYFPTAFLVGIGANRVRTAVAERQRAGERIRGIVESASDAHVSFGEHGAIVEWNPAAERLFGWTAAEAIGMPVAEIALPGEVERFEERMDRFRGGDRDAFGLRAESVVRDRHGREFPVESVTSAFEADGEWTVTVVLRDISERRREEGVRRRLAAIVESSADAIVSCAPDGRILTWNPAAERIFGYSEAEALGMPIATIASRDDPEEVASVVRRALAGESIENLRTARTAKGGRQIEVSVGISPITDDEGNVVAVSGILRDISAQVLTEQYIEAEHRAATILASAAPTDEVGPAILPIVGEAGRWAGGISWTVDADETKLCCDASWPHPGVSADLELPDVGEERALPPDAYVAKWSTDGAAEQGFKTRLWVPIAVAGAVYGGVELVDRRHRDQDDELVTVMTSIATLVGNYIGRHRAEEQAERAKDEFFALVSHELRTPLTSIIGYADLLADAESEGMSEDGRAYLEVIRRNAEREMRLVADLLLLVKIQEGTFAVDLADSTDLARIVSESVEAARPAAARRDVSLASSVEATPPLQGDAHRLGQVVDNLLSNAIKFTPSGGSVEVRLGASNGTAAIEVADDGAGIPEAQRAHLFDRLYRAPEVHAAHVPGLGLGLTIVKAIVDAHGGTVGVAGRDGGGTTFTVELPIREGRAK